MAGYVVTGGTGALGRVVVAALVREGHAVAVPYRSASGWDALRAAVVSDRVWGLSTDIADPNAAVVFMEEAARRTGGLSGLAAVAGGYAGTGAIEVAPPSEWRDMMRANLDSAWSASRAVLPHLSSGGSIVTVASRLAQAGGAGAAAYAVSKAAVLALTRVMALETRDRGVRVNCVLPGTIDTPANRDAMPKADRSAWTPPEAIAAVITYLLSPASAAVTGAVIPVDAKV